MCTEIAVINLFHAEISANTIYFDGMSMWLHRAVKNCNFQKEQRYPVKKGGG